jgi:dGTPase
MTLKWMKLMNQGRRKDKGKGVPPKEIGRPGETRTETERDYDRILFSTPVRRLADKTQVFPLEKNDSVRTRLTHSHEVSNLARSVGTNLAFNKAIASEVPNYLRNVPAMLAAAGLAHDLGNPPFGHKGEVAIQDWFKVNEKKWNTPDLTVPMKEDFLGFEGNAQTLRILTKLQLLQDEFGLNVTYGTLAALMKYTVPSDKTDRSSAATKKHGFFQSERAIVEDIWAETGLYSGARHPFAYVMEACDDIAYSVLDAEDAVKKSLASFPDLIAFLEHNGRGDPLTKDVCERAKGHNSEFRTGNLSPAELNDISMQMFRVHAIGALIAAISDAFLASLPSLMDGSQRKDLIDVSAGQVFCGALKEFDRRHAYVHRAVLEVELTGYRVIQKLMDYFWEAIEIREKSEQIGSKRPNPFSNYTYNRISENYRRIAEDPRNTMPLRYREMQLMTDMISGMTDTFAISLCEELEDCRGKRESR